MTVDLFGDGSFMSGGCLTIKPLRQPGKSPEAIGTRTIQTASVTGENEITLDLKNEEHNWTFIQSPQVNGHVIWFGGGCPPFYVPDPLTIDSFDEPGKSLGSPAGGLQRGDAVGIALPGYEDWRFAALQALARGGAEAENWGETIISAFDVEIGGYFTPLLSNRELATPGTYGQITPPESGNFVADGAAVYTQVYIDNVERPTSLAAGTFWLSDREQRIYWSPANNGANLTIRYGVTGKVGTFTESHTIDTQPVVSTGMSYATWAGADSTSVKYYNGGATVTGYTASDVSGTLHMQFSGADAGKKIAIRANKAGVVDPPGTGKQLAAEDLMTNGKKMDRVILFDESGLLAAHIEALEGLSISFYWSDGVFFGKAEPEWTEYQKDEWAALDAADYVSEHGRGNIHIRESWFIGKPERICFRMIQKLFDHRGFVPASLVNKTQDAIAQLNWVLTGMVPIADAALVADGAAAFWEYDATIAGTGESCEGLIIAVGPGYTESLGAFGPEEPANFWERTHEEAPRTVFARFQFLGTPLGMPEIFQRLADGCTIQEARFQVSCNSTYYKEETTKIQTSTSTTVITTDPPELSYCFLAVLRDGTTEFIGAFPGIPNGVTQVIDGTEIAQAMWARARDGNTVGYCVVVTLDSFGSGDGVETIVRGMRLPHNVAPFDWDNDSIISCTERIIRTPEIHEILTWENPNIGAVHLRIGYPEGDSRDVVVPQWPMQD